MNDLINDDEIILRVDKIDDQFIVVDQHGRRVRGIISLQLNASYQDATVITMDVFCGSEDGKSSHVNFHVNRAKASK